MIDPAVSLAFTLHSSPGAYAALIGSGVSRSSGIPTGWEITLELVRRLATAQGIDDQSDPETWYAAEFGKAPDYSDLLGALCKTATERQALLRGYFEPTAEEREQGLKIPTPAHEALAELMASGHIRVALTTNFDRLLEHALEARGIVPTVIANADQASGMLPLVHQRCCILKLHGDYLDTRIKNTGEELQTYAPAMDELLDQVLDEFGLIVCGWSATWDEALRAAAERTKARRFSWYWTTVGEPSTAAKALIHHRAAETIQIDSADRFWASLADRVTSLTEMDRPSPISAQAAMTSLKRYIVEDRYRIKLHDLLFDAVKDARAFWGDECFDTGAPLPDTTSMSARLRKFEAGAEILIALGIGLGRWGTAANAKLASEVLQRLAQVEPQRQGHSYVVWSGLCRYPALLFLASTGMAAMLGDNAEIFGSLVRTPLRTESEQEIMAINKLTPSALAGKDAMQHLEGMERRHAPLNNWIESVLREHFRGLVPSDEEFSLLFDRYEFSCAVAYFALGQSGTGWVPPGAWGYRHGNRKMVEDQIKRDMDERGEQSFALRSNVFGTTASKAVEAMTACKEFVGNLHWY